MRELISVDEAKEIIKSQCNNLPPRTIPLDQCAGLVLASAICAQTDVPPFNQSSMDGYAFSFDGWRQNPQLTLKGQSAAGEYQAFSILPEQAARIFTGAAVPEGADTVVMQEKTLVSDGVLNIDDPGLTKGQNFRKQGSEITKGSEALAPGTLMTPAAIGFAAGMGVSEVTVYPPPAVALILTGNELCRPGRPLKAGQVYESNSFALKAALEDIGVKHIRIFYAEDELTALSNVFSDALESADFLILSGGVSVGDYDFVLRAAFNNGVKGLFHKVRQKPGKPLFFGRKAQKLIFGLPGNPGSVMSCFYQYVQPCIGEIMHLRRDLKTLQVPLKDLVKKPEGLTCFMKAFFDGETVGDLSAQESFRLSSFAMANCLMELPEGKAVYQKGEIVTVHVLPGFGNG